MVTPKIITILAGGAVAASVGVGALALQGGSASAVTSKAAMDAQLDCERIAEQIRTTLDVEAPDDLDTSASTTMFVTFDPSQALADQDAVSPELALQQMRVDGRVTMNDLTGTSQFQATTLTGESLAVVADSDGQLTVNGAPVICGDIETNLGLVHATATSDDLARLTATPDVDITTPDTSITDADVTIDGDVIVDPSADTDGDASLDADAEADASESDAEAEADIEADADAG